MALCSFIIFWGFTPYIYLVQIKKEILIKLGPELYIKRSKNIKFPVISDDISYDLGLVKLLLIIDKYFI